MTEADREMTIFKIYYYVQIKLAANECSIF